MEIKDDHIILNRTVYSDLLASNVRLEALVIELEALVKNCTTIFNTIALEKEG